MEYTADELSRMIVLMNTIIESVVGHLRKLREEIDCLSVYKAGVCETELLGKAMAGLTLRMKEIESKLGRLENVSEVMLHTSFKVDPESVQPLLWPLQEQITEIIHMLDPNNKLQWAIHRQVAAETLPAREKLEVGGPVEP
jgi:hypothetical protein